MIYGLELLSKRNGVYGLDLIAHGGPGSGNHGHGGRPGAVGGSSSSGAVDENKEARAGIRKAQLEVSTARIAHKIAERWVDEVHAHGNEASDSERLAAKAAYSETKKTLKAAQTKRQVAEMTGKGWTELGADVPSLPDDPKLDQGQLAAKSDDDIAAAMEWHYKQIYSVVSKMTPDDYMDIHPSKEDGKTGNLVSWSGPGAGRLEGMMEGLERVGFKFDEVKGGFHHPRGHRASNWQSGGKGSVKSGVDIFIANTGTFTANQFVTHGGPGSGNFGHEGRPGEQGGSGAGGGTAEKEAPAKRPTKKDEILQSAAKIGFNDAPMKKESDIGSRAYGALEAAIEGTPLQEEMDEYLGQARNDYADSVVSEGADEYDVLSEAGHDTRETRELLEDLLTQHEVSGEHASHAMRMLDTSLSRVGGAMAMRRAAGAIDAEGFPEDVQRAILDLADEMETDEESARDRIEQSIVESASEGYDDWEDRRSWLSDNVDRINEMNTDPDATYDKGVWYGDLDDSAQLQFETRDGKKYDLFASFEDQHIGGQEVSNANVAFADEEGSFSLTGAGGGPDVFSNVLAGVTALVQKKQPDTVTFTAAYDTSDEALGKALGAGRSAESIAASRVRLYDLMTKTLAKVIPGYSAIYYDVGSKTSGHRQYVVLKTGLKEAVKTNLIEREAKYPGTTGVLVNERFTLALIRNLWDASLVCHGGQGSGNFGHSGRPGERGGSTKGESNAATETSESRLQDGRGVGGGDVGVESSGRTAVSNAPLDGAPKAAKVGGRTVKIEPDLRARQAAADYMKKAGLDYNPPKSYAKVDVARATKIADLYDKMEHNPQDPEVKAAYKALADETLAQYQAILDTGLKIDVIDFEKDGDPYAQSPRLAIEDIKNNNHFSVFPTSAGFGSDEEFDPEDNPLLAKTEFSLNGKQLVVNDVFRIVHDYFGHAKEGNGMRADGEENAWRGHAAMFSPQARRAMTTETRGQNSWVNFGPFAEHNQTASGGTTHYADQKIGLLPEWVTHDGVNNMRSVASLLSNSNPEGCNQHTGPGCASGKIEQTAFRGHDGTIYKSGPVHTYSKIPKEARDVQEFDSGFVTTSGHFLTRQEAAEYVLGPSAKKMNEGGGLYLDSSSIMQESLDEMGHADKKPSWSREKYSEKVVNALFDVVVNYNTKGCNQYTGAGCGGETDAAKKHERKAKKFRKKADKASTIADVLRYQEKAAQHGRMAKEYHAMSSHVTTNENPEGCNQYTGPGCGNAGEDIVKGTIEGFEKKDGSLTREMAAREWDGETLDALRAYTNKNIASDLNGQLRKCPNPPDCLNKEQQELFDKLESEAKEPLAAPQRAYRGMYGGYAEQMASLEEGDVYTMSGMVSTSINAKVASDFGESDKGGKITVFEITAKTGAYVSHISNFRNELELVQAHGVKYRVSGKREEGKITVVQVEEIGHAI